MKKTVLHYTTALLSYKLGYKISLIFITHKTRLW